MHSLTLLRFEVVHYREWLAGRSQMRMFGPGKWLVPNFPYTTLYGSRGRCEFVLDAPCQDRGTFRLTRRGRAVAFVECKYQDASGSCDEKLPYIARTFQKNSQIENMIVFFEGAWWTRGRGKKAVDWLRHEADAISHQQGRRLIVVENMEAFFALAERHFSNGV